MENKIFLSSIDLHQLKTEITDAVLKEINPAIQTIQKPQPQLQLLTRKEASVLLGISLPTLLDWTKTGKITGYRISSRIRYKRSEIEESLQKIKSGK